ncbi:MAG TPA: phosphate ABC transporter permease, partial [Pseudomonas sp.]|nr:phosphate ABC transporter permease [Pseudomonas sp.]
MNDLASETMTASSKSLGLDFNTPALQRKRRIRALKDRFARWAVSVGGLAVLGAITLIFFYLAYVVLPMFQGASLDSSKPMQAAWLKEAGTPLLLTLEEQNQMAMRLDQNGQVQFFDAKKMHPLSSVQLPIPADVQIASVGQDQPGSNRVALGLSNGQVLVFQHVYKITYPNDVKTIAPSIEYPFGEAPIELDAQGRALDHVGLSLNSGTLMLAASTGTELHVLSLGREENMMTGEVTLSEERVALPQIAEPIKALIIDPRHLWLYVVNGRATADVFDMRSKTLNGRYKLLADGKLEVSNATSLLGGISLMIGDSSGAIAQWFMVREDDGKAVLKSIRSFQLADSPIVQILPEERRKGFFALDAKGNLGIFHSTAHRTLLVEPVAEGQALAAL